MGYDIVLTRFGEKDKVHKVAVSLFDDEQFSGRDFCDYFNDLTPKDDTWAYAEVIQENKPVGLYALIGFYSIKSMDDRSVQNLLRNIDRQDLVMALADADEDIAAKVFKNVSKNAAAELRADLERARAHGVDKDVVKIKKDEIVHVIKNLHMTGEINFIEE